VLFLTPFRQQVEDQLAVIVQEMPTTQLSRAIGYAFEAGGKRLRPAIVLMMAEALGAPAPIWPAATVECFHIASLIADDLPCMDDAAQRRSLPSLHKAFGETVALLASYALISEGYGALERQRLLHPQSATACLAAYAVAARNIGCNGLIGGQYDDLLGGTMTEEELLRVSWMKTGALFEIAFVFGWLFGGGDAQRLDTVRRLAGHYALAFQIADDLADQEEDAQLPHTVNFALAVGEQRAKERLAQEMRCYRDTLGEAGLESEGLLSLMQLVEAT
jgi:geranylgeranyl diphosphate synthase type II